MLADGTIISRGFNLYGQLGVPDMGAYPNGRTEALGAHAQHLLNHAYGYYSTAASPEGQ